jgi:hypothetical protein
VHFAYLVFSAPQVAKCLPQRDISYLQTVVCVGEARIEGQGSPQMFDRRREWPLSHVGGSQVGCRILQGLCCRVDVKMRAVLPPHNQLAAQNTAFFFR